MVIMETLSFAKSLRNYESKQGHFKQHKPYNHISNFNNRKTLFNIKIDDDGRTETNNSIKLNTINEDNNNNNNYTDNTIIQRNVNTAKTNHNGSTNNLSKSLISLRKSMPSINYQSNDIYTGKISDQRLFDRQYKIENYGQKSILFSSNHNTNSNTSNSNTNLNNNKISTSTLNLVLSKPTCQQMNIKNTKLNEIDLNLHQNQQNSNQYDSVSNNILINTKPSLSRLSKSANNNIINQQVITIQPKKLLKENTSSSFKPLPQQPSFQPLIATLNGIKLKKSHTTQYISNISNNITNSSKLPMLATVDTADNSILNSARQNQSVLTSNNTNNNLRVSTSASRNRFQNSKYLYFSQSSSFESQSPETHAHNQNSLLKVNGNNNSNQQKQASQDAHIADKEIKPPATTKDAFELKLRNNNKFNSNSYNYNKINDIKPIQNEEEEEEEEEEDYNEINEIEYLNDINRKCTEWLEKYVLPNISLSNYEDKTIHI